MFRSEYGSSDTSVVGMADAEQIRLAEEGYKTLSEAKDCHSLLKKYLTEEVLNKLKAKKTKLGATLWDVIQSGELMRFIEKNKQDSLEF